MLTSKNRIHRRTLLRGAGGLAIGLPFLSAMLRPGQSHAADETPLRLVIFYTPGGTLLDKWLPTAGASGLTLQPMLESLAPFRESLTFVQGLGLQITQLGVGHPHSRGMAGVLTGRELLPGSFATNGGNASFANGISIDQLVAERISTGLPLKSLEVSAGWSTGLGAGGMPHPANVINSAGVKQPIPPSGSPLGTFKRLFGDGSTDLDAQRLWSTTILDGVAEEYRRLSLQLGVEDRQKLEAHLALIEQSRRGLDAEVNAACKPPTGVNTDPKFYEDGFSDGGASDGGSQAIGNGAKVSAKGAVMTELLVAALACGSTHVGTMQWADSEAKFLLGFLKDNNGKALVDHHHGYQHDRGFQPGSLEVIYRFYAERFADLLQRMSSVVEGNGKTLLDNSLVVAVSEIQKPDSHDQRNMPFILAGGAGGRLRGNRLLKVPEQPHNNLLVSIANLFGGTETTFGHPDFCTGALAGVFDA
jgi:Protein of unknown function (DUF1552)